MADTTDDVEVAIEIDGEHETITVPAGLLDRLGEGDETAAEVVGSVAVMSFAGRAHAMVHHSHDEPDDELVALEERMLDLFEERFGVTYGEATGHSH